MKHSVRFLSILLATAIFLSSGLNVLTSSAFAEQNLLNINGSKILASQVGENVADSNAGYIGGVTSTTTGDSIFIDVGQPPSDEEEYKLWKQNLVIQMNQQPRIGIMGLSGNKVYNNFLEYAFSSDGRFTIGTTGGNPDNPNDDYKKMLYGHPSSRTSFSTIKVDGSDYVFSAQSVNTDASNLSTTATQIINGVNVVQELKIVTNSNTGKADTVQIKYTATNQSSIAHSVGTRIMMDTMLGNNDAAPFRIPRYGAVTTELELTGNDIPDYWQAFDSLTNPSVIAQGTLLRTDNKPDKVQFSNWGRVSGTLWDFNINPGASNGDSAITIYWNPTTLQPGESKTYVTYYGLSDFMQDLSGDIGLTLNRIPSIEATTSGYYPNPIAVTGYIINNGNTTLNNIKAKITLPFGMRVYDDQTEITIGSIAPGGTRDFAWDVVLPEFQTETNLNYTVEVSAGGVEPKSLSYNFTVPATKVSSEALKYYEGAKYSIGAYNILTGQSTAIVDPVDAATGNFILNNTDIMVNGYNPFSFYRFYNSVDNWEGSLGKNWHTNYETTLTRLSDEMLSIRFDDGHIEEFTKDSDSFYQPMPGKYGVVVFTDGQGYQLTQKDKTKYTFDLSGFLTSIQDISGNTTTLIYDSGKLVKVQNECGSLHFQYNTNNLLSKITDDAGRTVEYGYNSGNLTSFKDVDGNTSTFVYDEQNRLTVVIDPAGNAKVTNIYDDKNRVIKQTMADNTVNTMSYDETNKSTTLTDRNGAQVTYKWDDQFRIYETVYVNGTEKAVFNSQSQKTAFTDKNGNTYHYEFDSNGNITKETNPLGQVIEYTFDSNNQVTSIKKADGSVTSYAYDSKGNLIGAKDPLNREMRLEYNEKSLPVKMVLPDGSSSILEYDAKGNIISAIDPLGNKTTFEYDLLNRVVNIIKPKGSKISFEYTPSGKVRKIINPDGTTSETTYDARGLVIEEKDTAGNVTKSKYNSMGHLIETTDALGNVTKYERDSMWNISKITLPNGAESKFHYNNANLLDTETDAANNSKFYEYDSNGNLLKETDFNGNQSSYAYDALNRLIQVTDANNNSTKFVYGLNGKLQKLIDAMQQATQYEYDAAGQLIKVTDVIGNSTHYSYNSLGYVESITDAKGAVTRYQYDALGNVTKIINPDNSQSSFEYDQHGNLLITIDAKGNATTYEYDEMDRVIKITDALGETKSVKYTLSGQIGEAIDENGNRTQYKYDALDRLIEVIDAKGNSTKYEYDALGNLTKVQRPVGVDQDVLDSMKTNTSDYQAQTADMITKYEYDIRGLLIKEIDPAGKINTFEYDNNGRILSEIDRDNLKTQFEYDVVGNIQKVIYDDGKQISYDYNPIGQMIEFTDWLGTSSFDLDALGRIKKVNDYRNETIEYTWSETGEKLSMKYPDGSLVKYDYDSMGRLTTVTDSDKAATAYKYDILGNVSEKLLPNGIKTEYAYDSLSRLSILNNKDKKGKLLDTYRYIYDAAGNKTSITRKSYGEKSLTDLFSGDEGETKYKYDALNQLVEVNSPNKTTKKYYYDKLNNRIRQEYLVCNKDLFSENYIYDDAGRLCEITGSPSILGNGKKHGVQNTLKMEYDNRGNLIKTSLGDYVISQYTFNSANKLEEVTNWKNVQTSFVYDGLGRRVSETVQIGTMKSKEVLKLFKDIENKLKHDDFSSISKYFKDYDNECDGFGKGLNSYTKTFTMDIASPYNNLIGIESASKSSKFVFGYDVISITDQVIKNKGSKNKGSKNRFGSKSSEQKNYYLQDELGSPIRLVDGKGKTTERYRYDEFGTPISPKMALGLNKSSNPFGFTGYQYDTTTGLYFAQARYFDSGVGRFVSEDILKGKIAEPMSINRYNYCILNPVNYIDIDGKDAIWLTSKDMVRRGPISLGHTSLLLQDAEGNWHYFFYASNAVLVEKVEDLNALKSLSNLNDYLDETGERSYTSSTYIAGDFTASLAHVDILRKEYDEYVEKRFYETGKWELDNPYYDVLSNNCTTESWEALMLGKLNDGTLVKHFAIERDRNFLYSGFLLYPSIIPNNNQPKVDFLFKNSDFTLEDYKKTINEILRREQNYYDNLNWFERLFFNSICKNQINLDKKLLPVDTCN